jgi:hypothetical protein
MLGYPSAAERLAASPEGTQFHGVSNRGYVYHHTKLFPDTLTKFSDYAYEILLLYTELLSFWALSIVRYSKKLDTEFLTMDKVQKRSNSEYYTLSLEHFRIYYYCTRASCHIE